MQGVQLLRLLLAINALREAARRTDLGRKAVAIAAVLLLGCAVGLTVRPQGTQPRAGGVQPEAQTGITSVSLDALPYPLPQSDLAGFNAVDISRQQRTGTGAHSGDSVLRGSLT